jgi:hypothetical protein
MCFRLLSLEMSLQLEEGKNLNMYIIEKMLKINFHFLILKIFEF